jgi:Phytanoyl-CoA dioxygenase (PhyH)
VSDSYAELEDRGFVVLRGAVPSAALQALTTAYAAAMASASGDDIKHGSTSTRVTDFVNRGEVFDGIYTFPPLLEACERLIGRPFKLSSFHARTVHARAAAQGMHVDVRRHSRDWPLVGFILMVDAFRPDNGATRFLPGSQRWDSAPEDSLADVNDVHPDEELACGPAGSLIVFNGSTWHGHSANRSDAPRRSLQGAFIPREGHAATGFHARMQPETRERLSPVARHLLAL